MPRRIIPLATDHFYHIFNRGVNRQPIFEGAKDCNRFIQLLRFYRIKKSPTQFSKFVKLSKEQRKVVWQDMGSKSSRVDLVSYCLMPNHFHLLLKQRSENGISKFLADIQNSYVKYLNIKYNRIGPLFQGQFKNVLIEDDNQLLHTSRYIHLNPYSSNLVKDTKALREYQWSSLKEYVDQVDFELCQKEIILSNFKTKASYLDFILNQADYQRSLNKIKHLAIDL